MSEYNYTSSEMRIMLKIMNFFFSSPFIEYVYIIKEVCVDCVRFSLKIRKLDMNKALHLYVKSLV
jgi:hypothetical protein